jgi:hypothetical protein
LHLAYDFIAGRMAQVHVTDRFGGERLDRYTWQAGDVIVADNGYGYRRSVAVAVQQQADVIVRIHPATFPLETEAGTPFKVLRWLRHRGGPEREWKGWCRWEGRRYAVRLVAAKLAPAAAQRARRRRRRKAQKAGRTITAPTLAVAGWLLLITTLAAATWSAADVLYVYRARWQVEICQSCNLRRTLFWQKFDSVNFHTARRAVCGAEAWRRTSWGWPPMCGPLPCRTASPA